MFNFSNHVHLLFNICFYYNGNRIVLPKWIHRSHNWISNREKHILLSPCSHSLTGDQTLEGRIGQTLASSLLLWQVKVVDAQRILSVLTVSVLLYRGEICGRRPLSAECLNIKHDICDGRGKYWALEYKALNFVVWALTPASVSL